MPLVRKEFLNLENCLFIEMYFTRIFKVDMTVILDNA